LYKSPTRGAWMKIKISKIILQRNVDITIDGINCTFENIKKVIDIFNIKHIILTIDSLSKSSSVFLVLNDLGLNYILSSNNSEIVEATVLVPSELIYLVLEEAIKEDPENLFISNLIDIEIWKDLFTESPQTLLESGYSDLTVIVSRDRQSIFLSFIKTRYNFNDVLNKIKEIYHNKGF